MSDGNGVALRIFRMQTMTRRSMQPFLCIHLLLTVCNHKYIFIIHTCVDAGFELAHKSSATGTRTQVARVRAEYPDQLDYSALFFFIILFPNHPRYSLQYVELPKGSAQK